MAEEMGRETYESTMRVIESVQEALTQKYIHTDERKKAMLAKELADYFKLPGSTAVCKHVPGALAYEMEMALQKQNIPYQAFRTDVTGDALFVVGENHGADFMQIQEDVFALSTLTNRQCTAKEMFEIGQRAEDKQMVQVSIEDRELALVLQQKMYNTGVVCAVHDFGDVPYETPVRGGTINSSVNFYLNRNALFDERKGRDLAYVELQHALVQSFEDENLIPKKEINGKVIPNYAEIRKQQAKYDDRQVSEFARKIARGEHVVLRSQGSIDKRLYIECDKDGVFVKQAGKEDRQLHIEEGATLHEIKALVSRYTDGMRNMVVQDGALFKAGKDVEISENQKRPKGNDIDSKASEKAQEVLEAVNKEATAMIAARKIKDPYEALKEKRTLMVEMLKHPENTQIPELIEFARGNHLELTGGKTNVDWLSHIADHLSNTNENKKSEMHIEEIPLNRQTLRRIQKETESIVNIREEDRYREEKTETVERTYENDRDEEPGLGRE